MWCDRPVSWLCRKILLMHPWNTPSILATSRWELPSADNLTIRCSICSANFVASSPLKFQRNINSLYRNPTLHKSIKVVMARQTSLQMNTPELNFFLLLSLSGPQTILTVFGHSIWLCNGSMKSTVFCSAISIAAVLHKTIDIVCGHWPGAWLAPRHCLYLWWPYVYPWNWLCVWNWCDDRCDTTMSYASLYIQMAWWRSVVSPVHS